MNDARVTRRMLLGGITAGAVLPAAARVAPPPLKTELMTPAGRAVTVWRWRPARAARGMILFSHGAASSPLKYDGLLRPWLAEGWEIVAPLHVDSTDHPAHDSYKGLSSWVARVEDLRLVAARMIEGPFVAAGHSYGGLCALAMGGARSERASGVEGEAADPRVRCVVAFSPPATIPGFITESGYAALRVPALIETGTKDIPPMPPPIDPEGWHQHLAAFDASVPGGDRYGLVLDGVDHYFGGAICDFAKPGPPQTTQLARAAGVAALFMDAYGRRRIAARKALDAQVGKSPGLSLTKR